MHAIAHTAAQNEILNALLRWVCFIIFAKVSWNFASTLWQMEPRRSANLPSSNKSPDLECVQQRDAAFPPRFSRRQIWLHSSLRRSPSLCPGPHCHLISEPIETMTQLARPHYVALFRGHLNFSTVSLLSQTTFRYSMSNKSPEQLSPLFVLKLTNVTGAFYISPDSGELANSLCLCSISYSLNPHNQIQLFSFFFLWLHLLFPLLLGNCGALRHHMNQNDLPL